MEAHKKLTICTGYLTAQACGEIAAEARVENLVPFHLSRRYVQKPDQVFAEIIDVCAGVAVVSSSFPGAPRFAKGLLS